MGDNGKRNHCNLSSKATEWLNGELLGDGHLESRNSYSTRFMHGSKYLEYTQYMKRILESFGIKGGDIRKRYYEKLNCYSYHYRSLRYVELLSLRKQWYPKGKKIVPRNIKLTPLICRQWYIGDGSLSIINVHHRSRIKLHTNGFTVVDVEWLIKQLTNLEFKITRTTKNIISISTYSTKEFLDYIGLCPVECYQYKWNYQDKRRSLLCA